MDSCVFVQMIPPPHYNHFLLNKEGSPFIWVSPGNLVSEGSPAKSTAEASEVNCFYGNRIFFRVLEESKETETSHTIYMGAAVLPQSSSFMLKLYKKFQTSFYMVIIPLKLKMVQ